MSNKIKEYSVDDVFLIMNIKIYEQFGAYKDSEKYLLLEEKNTLIYVLPPIVAKDFQRHKNLILDDSSVSLKLIIDEIVVACTPDDKKQVYLFLPFFTSDNCWVTCRVHFKDIIHESIVDNRHISYSWYNPLKITIKNQSKYNEILINILSEHAKNVMEISPHIGYVGKDGSSNHISLNNYSGVLAIENIFYLISHSIDATASMASSSNLLKDVDLKDIEEFRKMQLKSTELELSDSESELINSFIKRHRLNNNQNNDSDWKYVLKNIDSYIRGETINERCTLAATVFMHLFSAASSTAIIPVSVLLAEYIVDNTDKREDGFTQDEFILIASYAGLLLLDYSLDSCKGLLNYKKTNQSTKAYLNDIMKTSNVITVNEDEIAKITNEMWIYDNFNVYISSIISMPINFVKVFASFALIGVYYGWWFAGVLGSSLFLTVLNNLLKIKYHSPLNTQSSNSYKEVIAEENDLLLRQTDIKLYGKQKMEEARIDRSLNKFSEVVNKSVFCNSIFDLTQKLNYSLLFSSMTILAVYYYHEKNDETGRYIFEFDDFTFIEMFTLRFIFFLSGFNGDFYKITDTLVWLKQKSEMIQSLKQRKNIQPKDGHEIPQKNLSALKFQDVGLFINGKEILKNVSFEVLQGEKIAILGKSGSGKSTLFKLIMRELNYTSGRIVFEDSKDVEITNYNITHLRNHIAYFPQRPNLFSASVKKNMLYVKADENKILLLENKNLHNSKRKKFLRLINRENSDALDCNQELIKVEMGGTTKSLISGLSGGEKQRISLAKGLFRSKYSAKVSLYLFDEITSALDSEKENQIQELLYLHCKNKTTLIVTHHLRLIENSVDKVLILKEKGAGIEFYGSIAEAKKNKYFIKLLEDEKRNNFFSNSKPNFFGKKDPLSGNDKIHYSLPKGLIYEAVNGDGNCLYSAVDKYLGMGVSTLRDVTYEYIKNHKNEFVSFSEEDWELNKIKSDQWAGNIEIFALMKIYSRPIVIIDAIGAIRNKEDVLNYGGNRQKPIFVFYNGKDHYDALIAASNFNVDEILATLLKAPQQESDVSLRT